MAPTRAERAASTRHKLLDAAIEQFLDKPYDDVSVHDLAKAAGVAYGLVAHHFGNKRGIHLEAVREMARRLEQGRRRQVPSARGCGTSPRPLRLHPAKPACLPRADARRGPDSRTIVDTGKELAVRLTSDVLDLDPERPAVRLALRSWLGTVNEAAVAWLQDGRRSPSTT